MTPYGFIDVVHDVQEIVIAKQNQDIAFAEAGFS